MKKLFFIFLFFVLLMISSLIFVNAHSLYLFDISLDFDKELKSNVIEEAQKFLNAKKKPLGFDLDKGLIIVHFEPEQRNYVEINPLGYEVYGMRNENLKHKTVTKKLTKEQGIDIAKKFFNKFPDKIKSELKYDPDVSEVDSTYFYKWFRYVNGILVVGEELMVNVDAFNGNIIAWRLSIFDYPKGSIDAVPAISSSIAKKVAELSFNAPLVDSFVPYLIINIKEPVWVIKLQGEFYPYFVGVSTKDGGISFTGTLPGEVPKGYNVGNEIQIVETELIKQIYASKWEK
ncbi:hypothetical protein J4234_01970 [Candidatus Woesearchaeota archaeon]|nr:hypothetical protein [Candidatus Woesearchaeota archaeon]